MIQKHSRNAYVLAIAAAAAAVIAGSILLLMLAAPMRMPIMNLGALGIGLAVLMILRLVARSPLSSAFEDASLIAAAALIPITAFFGSGIDGASRWLIIGGLTIQPALILVPPIALAFAQRPSAARLAAVGCAAAGLALQPDAGGAAMLFLGAAPAALLAPRAGKRAAAVGFVTGAALLIAWLRAPTLPAVPFVEKVLADALQYGPSAALVAAIALALMFVPAMLLRAKVEPAVLLAFVGVWAGGLVASVAASYPTPVIGFGGSAILGYFLSMSLMTARTFGVGTSATAPRAENAARGREDMKFA